MIILYSKHNFWGSVVPALHVEEPSGTVFATSSKIYNFNSIEPLVSEENVLWFHIAMYHLLILHILEPLAYLSGNGSQLLWLEYRVVSLVHSLVFVEVVT
jgi:hypothetical protein